MLYVKIMSEQDLPDADPFHNFTIVPVANSEVMRFVSNVVPDGQEGNKDGERFSLEVIRTNGDTEMHFLTGNAYVLTESGKTIASHGC